MTVTKCPDPNVMHGEVLFVVKRSLLQLFKGSAELVWTGCSFCATADAVETFDDIVDMLAANKLTDALKVTIASSKEKHLLNHIVLVGSYINQFRASAVSFILYMFCFHNSLFLNFKYLYRVIIVELDM